MPKRKPRKTLVNKTTKPRKPKTAEEFAKSEAKRRVNELEKRIMGDNSLASAIDVNWRGHLKVAQKPSGLLKKATKAMEDDTIFHEDYYGSHDGEVKSKLMPRKSIWQWVKGLFQ